MIKSDNSYTHDCDNTTCQLLNPSLERLLEYEDLSKRVAKVEEIFFEDLCRMRITKSFPLGLFGWTHAHRVFQLLNVEFIRELANKIKEIDPEIILEVGAGEGLLGKYLSKELGKKLGEEIILTDDYSWWEKENTKIENKDVIRKDYKDAIKEYSPDFIIASWIPYERWWTKEFRNCESVKAYILIGEGPGGCTGSDMDWKTPWIMNGLDDVERFGICRADHGFNYGNGYYGMKHTNVSLFERPERY